MDNTSRKHLYLIKDFLIPALNENRYPENLQWIDQENRVFSLVWNHKNSATWSVNDACVFTDWDKAKNRYRPEEKGYYMQAKQRFRSALHKLDNVQLLSYSGKNIKVYRILELKDKKAKNESDKKSESDSSQEGNGDVSLRPDSKDQLFNGVAPTQPALQEFATDGSRRDRAIIIKNNITTKRVVKHASAQTPEKHTGNCDTNIEIKEPAVPVDVPPSSASTGCYIVSYRNGPFTYTPVQPLTESPDIFVVPSYYEESFQ